MIGRAGTARAGGCTLRIIVLNPPPGVVFRLQRGRSELVPPSQENGESMSFDFELRVADRDGEAAPRLLGPFAQGPPASRFVYVNSGKQAGQTASCWDRRAKVPLGGLTWALLEQAMATPGAVIETAIAGMAGDGGPACATVPLARPWRMARS
jgi:hypothetical protein